MSAVKTKTMWPIVGAAATNVELPEPEFEPWCEHPTAKRQLFFKTKLCKFNKVGKCRAGSQCMFSHSGEELQPLPDGIAELKQALGAQQQAKQLEQHQEELTMQMIRAQQIVYAQLVQKVELPLKPNFVRPEDVAGKTDAIKQHMTSLPDPLKVELPSAYGQEAFDTAVGKAHEDQGVATKKKSRPRYSPEAEMKSIFATRRLEKKDAKLFKKYDVDEDRFLDRAEIVNFAQGEYDFVPSPESLEHIFSCIVRTGCKGVPFKEFELLKKIVGIAKDQASHQEKQQVFETEQRQRPISLGGVGTPPGLPPPQSQEQAWLNKMPATMKPHRQPSLAQMAQATIML